MKNILIKKGILILIIGVLFSPFLAKASSPGTCSRNGYAVISINGMLTTAKGAVYNKNSISGVFDSKYYNNQKITFDYVYNETHNFVTDFIDSARQKVTEGFVSQTYDLTNMLSDLSQKIKTQKLLFVAHSQGNFYANDIYNSIGDQPGGVAKKSMGIYGIGTPTSYIAGNGKYILSSNDNIVNLVRLKGILKVLPANVNIVGNEEEGDDPNGHYLPIYLKHENKRIASEILTMLHSLKEDETQNEAEVCIDEPELTNLHKLMGVFYYVADPISEAIKDTFNTIVNTIGKPVTNTFWNLGNKLGKAINSMFASAGDSFTSNNNSPSIPSSDNTLSPQEDIYLLDEQIDEEEVQETINQNILAIENNKDESVIPNSSTEIKKIIHRSSHSSNENEEENNSNNEEEQDDENSDENNSGEGEGSGQDDEDNDEGDSEEEQDDTSADTTNPVVSLIGESYLKLSRGTDYTESGATAVDNIDGEIGVTIEGNVNTSVVGVYTIIYRATDSSGNKGSAERKVEIYIPLEGLIIDIDTTLPSGEYFYDNVTITNNATLTLLADIVSTGSGFKGVKINANNITIDSGSSISANGQGYIDGPGTNSENYAGGSYGGKGEYSQDSFVYGSAITPMDLGSAGAIQNSYYKGGGAIWLEVEDTITNNGIISANGGSNASGGSIYTNSKNIDGSGVFKADGGGLAATSLFYFPGSGGRVAIHYEENSLFSGEIQAKAGCGHVGYPDLDCGEDGTAGLFDEGENNLYVDSSWEFVNVDDGNHYNNVFVSNATQVRVEDGAIIDVDNFEMKDMSVLTLAENQNMNIRSVSLVNNSTITTDAEVAVYIKADNIYVDSTSKIDANYKGYIDGPGTPNPEDYFFAGASYGGKGSGLNAKSVYGSSTAPIDFGSGDNGDRGGGAIHIISSGEFINDGVVTALPYRNRGSGGSVYIEANKLKGSGSFLAYGGNGNWPYNDLAGGGGRIAIYYNENTFLGTTNVSGGSYCLYGCAKVADDGTLVFVDRTAPLEELSSEKEITSFSFADLIPMVTGIINGTDYTINATVPYDTDISALVPTISISSKATVSKASGVAEDFTSLVTYMVTAEDGSTRNYTVSVQVAEETEGDGGAEADDIPPLITEYFLNGTTEDVIVDPFNEGLVIVLTANEKVDLVSLEIENKSNTSIRKIYYSCDTYDTDTNTCTKTWNGALSGSTYSLEEGDYRVNVHIKDVALNETFYTLPATVTVIKK